MHKPVSRTWVDTHDGLYVVAPALASLQISAHDGVQAGLVALDGVLHRAEEQDKAEIGLVVGRHLTGPRRAEVLAQLNEALESVHGDRAAQSVIELADGGAASALPACSTSWK